MAEIAGYILVALMMIVFGVIIFAPLYFEHIDGKCYQCGKGFAMPGETCDQCGAEQP